MLSFVGTEKQKEFVESLNWNERLTGRVWNGGVKKLGINQLTPGLHVYISPTISSLPHPRKCLIFLFCLG